jgi:NAD-dependent SIR2 family protein deacetylase
MNGYSAQIEKLKFALETAGAIVVGAGAGLSTSAGLTYDGERFQEHFADFIEKYHFRDMYSAGFYPYATPEEHWAYWSRYIFLNRYDSPVGKPYSDLLRLLKDRNYFVITTNVDHQFQRAGFDKERLFYTQGDFGLWQCSVPCHQATYDNETTVRRMVAEQRDMQVPTGLLPTCPKCGEPITMNLRGDDKFVEDEGWHKAQRRYSEFLQTYANGSVLFLELGVGGNTPVIIKYPFWKMTYQNPSAVYCCINLGEAVAPKEIAERSICVDADIGQVLNKSE